MFDVGLVAYSWLQKKAVRPNVTNRLKNYGNEVTADRLSDALSNTTASFRTYAPLLQARMSILSNKWFATSTTWKINRTKNHK